MAGGFVCRAVRPAALIVVAAAVGISIAILLYSFANITAVLAYDTVKWLASSLDDLGKLFEFSRLRMPRDEIRASYQASGIADTIALSTAAVGIGVVAALLRDIHKAMADLIAHWMAPSRSQLSSAFWSVAVGFVGVGLSVYGAETALERPKVREESLHLEVSSLPPFVLGPKPGSLTFYVSFPGEGGAGSLVDPEHDSLVPTDKAFVENLGRALALCAEDGSVVVVELRGYASGSQWIDAYSELTNWTSRTLPAPPQLPTLRAEVASIAALERGYPADKPGAFARAFNVWLANQRREKVKQLLLKNAGANVTVSDIGKWKSHQEMSDAYAIDDRSRDFATIGVLTRAVAVTIAAAGTCDRERGSLTRLSLSSSR